VSVISSNLPGREISEDGRFLVALTVVQDIVSAGMRAIACTEGNDVQGADVHLSVPEESVAPLGFPVRVDICLRTLVAWLIGISDEDGMMPSSQSSGEFFVDEAGDASICTGLPDSPKFQHPGLQVLVRVTSNPLWPD
jgi:hypothetical protein